MTPRHFWSAMVLALSLVVFGLIMLLALMAQVRIYGTMPVQWDDTYSDRETYHEA
jgi:hypothetical protein